MKDLKKHYEEGRLAHAYFLAGPKKFLIKSVYKFANFFFYKDEKETLPSSPDFFEYLSEKFGISDAHELRRRALMKSFSGQGKIFLIDADSFTFEAAHALLKIFEEPPRGTYFFLISENPRSLPPTLRSRLVILNFINDDLSEVKKNSIEKFLKTTPQKRLLYLKDIMEDRDRSLNFLRALEIVLASRLEKNVKEKKDFSLSCFLEEAGEFEAVLSQRLSSPRFILEHIALTLPRMP